YAGMPRIEMKSLVIEPSVEVYTAALALGALDLLGRVFEGRLDCTNDLAAKSGLVAASLGFECDAVSDDVGRFAAVDVADVAGPLVPSFFDQAVPAAVNQVGDG